MRVESGLNGGLVWIVSLFFLLCFEALWEKREKRWIGMLRNRRGKEGRKRI